MLTTKKRLPPKPTREERCAALVASARPAVGVVMATAQSLAGQPVKAEAAKLPRKARTMQSLRDAARGHACLLRLPGCHCDGSMAIWSHCRHHYAGKGGSIKSHDLLGAFACPHCDAIYDGNAPRPAGLTQEAVELAWWKAHAESIVIYAREGVL